MQFDLQGRVAMIAAASKGIGKACALALAAEGCKVSLCARNAEELEKARAGAAQHAEALAVVTDVSAKQDLEQWYQQTVAAFGQVDILVTNTGGPPVSRFMQLSDEQWLAGVDS